MAKKKSSTKKKAPARTTRRKTASKVASKKKTAKKTASSRAPAKKVAKTTKKSGARASVKKKPSVKKAAKKTASRKSSKTASKKTGTKPASKEQPKKEASKQPAPKAQADRGTDVEAKKSGRKGITIVEDKKKKRPVRSSKPSALPERPRLLGPGIKRKPLIPSAGPRVETIADTTADTGRKAKTPFTKRQLEKYNAILLVKRAELVGDITQMESDALTSNSGGLSSLPQHIAEQGSDSYDQSLSLNLAAADRKILKEIDDALQRIVDRTYGICELTGRPIKPERLEELPWARYSIEAAREMERRGGST